MSDDDLKRTRHLAHLEGRIRNLQANNKVLRSLVKAGNIQDPTRTLWNLYLSACACTEERQADCRCQTIAASALEHLLGDNWREIMQERTRT